MAHFSSKGFVVSVPALVLTVAAAAVSFLLLLLKLVKSSPQCSCAIPDTSVNFIPRGDHFSPSLEDIHWLKQQIETNALNMADNAKRKGINPRTREEQLRDLVDYKGIAHYDGEEANNHTALPCPNELLVEMHHSYYGEPWAGGRDVFDFLAQTMNLTHDSRVLEIGCGTLRVGLHFIRYLNQGHYNCLEKDELSLMAAFSYELPSQGLLYKQPLIVRSDNMDFTRFGVDIMYDLIYASAAFLHIPDTLVWTGVERLSNRLKPLVGRLFISHNVKFCTRLGSEECSKRLKNLGLEYMVKHTHDSLLFNHYETWFEFRRFKTKI